MSDGISSSDMSYIDMILEDHSGAIKNTNIENQTIDSIKEWIRKYHINLSTAVNDDIVVFIQELQKRISKLAYKDSAGRTVIPYMGMEDGVGAWQYSAAISSSDEGLTYISDIEIGRTLNELWGTVAEKFEIDDEEKNNHLEEIFNGSNKNATYKNTDIVAINDYVSAIVMDNNISTTQTDLFACILEPKIDSVFMRTELPLILQKVDKGELGLETINGISIDELKGFLEQGNKQGLANRLVESTKTSMIERGYEFKVTYGDFLDGNSVKTELVAVTFIKGGEEQGSWKRQDYDEAQNKRDTFEVSDETADTNDAQEDLDNSNNDNNQDISEDPGDSDKVVDTDDLNQDTDSTTDADDKVTSNDESINSEEDAEVNDEATNSEDNTDANEEITDPEENVETNDEVTSTEENAETDEQVTDTTQPVEESEKVTDATEPVEEVDKVTDTTESAEEPEKVTDTTEQVEEVDKVTDTTEPAEEPEKVTDTTESVEEVDKITDTTEPVDKPDKVTDITEDIDKEDTVIDESETIKDVDKVADNTDIVEDVDDKINYDQSNDNTNFSSDDIGVDDIIHEAEVDNSVDLTDEGKKIVDAYEDASGNKVDIDSTPGMAKILNKLADAADKLGDAFDIFDAAYAVYNAVNLFAKGDKTGACKALSDYGFSTLGGMGAGMLATKLVTLCAINPLLGFATIFLVGFAGSVCGENISTLWFAKILGIYDEAGAYTFPVDPLILDLDGDGIETVSVENGVNFDFDSNGFAEKLGWVGNDDGLLVRDLNGNGQIDNGGELFGDLTLAEDYVAKNGFEALKYYDANADGVIDNADAVYSELYVWKDAA